MNFTLRIYRELNKFRVCARPTRISGAIQHEGPAPEDLFQENSRYRVKVHQFSWHLQWHHEFTIRRNPHGPKL